MIRIKCFSPTCLEQHAHYHDVTEEDFHKFVKLMGGLGPDGKCHAVVHYDCTGATSFEDLANPSGVLNEVQDRISGATKLEDLFNA